MKSNEVRRVFQSWAGNAAPAHRWRPAAHLLVACACAGFLRAGEAALPGNAHPQRLGYWRFNGPGWQSEEGRQPLRFTNLESSASFDGRALRVAPAAGPAFLHLRRIEPDGHQNFGATNGAVRFLYQPLWGTPNASALPGSNRGSGPGHWVRLLEAGTPAGNRWMPGLALSIDSTGRWLALHTLDAQKQPVTNLIAGINWTLAASAGTRGGEQAWREVVLVYTPTYCALIIDGQVMQDNRTKLWRGAGFGALPSFGAEGVLSIGSSLAGDLPAEGLIDELETFDHPITPLRNYFFAAQTALSASVITEPPSVTLLWINANGDGVSIRRRAAAESNWTALASNVTAMSFTDTAPDLRRGGLYEYAVNQRALFVGLDVPPVDERGRLILLVDQTLAPQLGASLQPWVADLVGDGWTVVRHDVPRHDDHAWDPGHSNRGYVDDLHRIRALVLADYQAQPAQTKAVILVGHVTVPYSGFGTEDGHAEHAGAWPADSFYGDLDGNWTDTQARVFSPNPVINNMPGDGKFDADRFNPHLLPSGPDGQGGLELAVGRIDFARLPAFAPRSEIDLLRQYLAKNHRYRHKQTTFSQGGIAAGYFFNLYQDQSQIIDANASWIGSRLYGVGNDRVFAGDLFAAPGTCLWGMQGGYGAYDAINNNSEANRALGIQRHSSADLARPENEPKIGFYVLKSSWFGDANLFDNCFLRAVLATPNYGLGAVFTLHTVWRFESAAVGDALVGGLVRTARGNESVRTTSFFGDPALRLFVTAPPARLTARKDRDRVILNWAASPETGATYLVYRSTNGPSGPFQRLTGAPVSAPTHTDLGAPPGPKVYQVRALQLLTTGSGSFTNNSQGLFVAVP